MGEQSSVNFASEFVEHQCLLSWLARHSISPTPKHPLVLILIAKSASWASRRCTDDANFDPRIRRTLGYFSVFFVTFGLIAGVLTLRTICWNDPL